MFAIAVPTGWGDEARRNVEDRIAANLQAFQVTCEQRIQALIQDAVNPVRAYFDSTILAMEERSEPSQAFDDRERGACPTSKLRAFYDALARLSRLDSASTASFSAPGWNTGLTSREGNIISKEELKNVTNFARSHFGSSQHQFFLISLGTAP